MAMLNFGAVAFGDPAVAFLLQNILGALGVEVGNAAEHAAAVVFGKPKNRWTKKKESAWMIIPVTKWLTTLVSKSPKWGCSPSKWAKWLINGGYYLLTNWEPIFQVVSWKLGRWAPNM